MRMSTIVIAVLATGACTSPDSSVSPSNVSQVPIASATSAASTSTTSTTTATSTTLPATTTTTSTTTSTTTTSTTASTTTSTTATTTTLPPKLDALGLSRAFGDTTAKITQFACGEGGHGSGFAVDDRHVVTNAHVIGADLTPDVHLRSGAIVAGELIGYDELNDLAVVRAPGGTFERWINWGDSDLLEEGAPVVVIGYPDLGDYDVVSLTVRSINDSDNTIRLPSGIDSGNSGSPAFDDDGKVIGVARAVSEGNFEIYGLLIPSATARPIVADMIAGPASYSSSCADASPPTTTPPATSPPARHGSHWSDTWLMQLASAPEDADPSLISGERSSLEARVAGVETLWSDDWPNAFEIPNRIIYYVGGYPNRDAVLDECERLALAYPDECYPRFLAP